jgi:SAM-dependent methyltransferase
MNVPSRVNRVLLNKVINIGKIFINPSNHVIPHWITSKADPERGIVDNFIKNLHSATTRELLLDVGAGNFRFQDYLETQGFVYESQDFDQVFDQDMRGKHTYVCDIENIPVNDGRFDVVVCTQVLEHLANPLIALQELSRILRKGGKLYLTTNFLFPIHGAPYDFFRYTNFGLEHLCHKSNFSISELQPRGGFYSFIAKIVFDFPAIIKSWLFYGGASPHGQRQIKVRNILIVLPLVPLVFLVDILCTLLAFLLARLDFMDKKKRFTLGYQLVAIRD